MSDVIARLGIPTARAYSVLVSGWSTTKGSDNMLKSVGPSSAGNVTAGSSSNTCKAERERCNE